MGGVGASEGIESKTEDLVVLGREGEGRVRGFGRFVGPLQAVVGAELLLCGLLQSSLLLAAAEESAIGCPLHFM